MLKRIKTIHSYSGLARWLDETDETPLGYIPKQDSIPSPYAYSPVHVVENWQGKPVIRVETGHREYRIFLVPHEMIIADEAKATEAYLRHRRACDARDKALG